MGPEQRLYLADPFGKGATGKQKFHPVAGRQKNQLIHVIEVREHMQRIHLFAARHGKLLPNFHGRRFVIHA
jgi:hypothetical protein